MPSRQRAGHRPRPRSRGVHRARARPSRSTGRRSTSRGTARCRAAPTARSLDTSTPAHEALRSALPARPRGAAGRRSASKRRTTPRQRRYELQPPFFSPRRAASADRGVGARSSSRSRASATPTRRRWAPPSTTTEAEVFLTVTDTIRLLIEAAHRPTARPLHLRGQGAPPRAVGRRHVAPALVRRGQRSRRRRSGAASASTASRMSTSLDGRLRGPRRLRPRRRPSTWTRTAGATTRRCASARGRARVRAPGWPTSSAARSSPTRTTTATVETESENREALIDRLLELGTQVRVVSPPEVVDDLCERLRQMAELR